MSPFRTLLPPNSRVYPCPSLLPTTHHPLPTCPALCFHGLTNPSYRVRDLQVLYFHAVTNPFSRNPFRLATIQNPRVSPLPSLAPKALCLVPPRPKSGFSVANPIFSAACRLLFSLGSLFRSRVVCFQYLTASFCKIPGVGVSESVWQLAFMPINRGEAFRSPQHIVVTTCEN